MMPLSISARCRSRASRYRTLGFSTRCQFSSPYFLAPNIRTRMTASRQMTRDFRSKPHRSLPWSSLRPIVIVSSVHVDVGTLLTGLRDNAATAPGSTLTTVSLVLPDLGMNVPALLEVGAPAVRAAVLALSVFLHEHRQVLSALVPRAQLFVHALQGQY